MRRIFEEYAREYRARKGAHSEYLPPRKNNHVEKEEERITIILDIYKIHRTLIQPPLRFEYSIFFTNLRIRCIYIYIYYKLKYVSNEIGRILIQLELAKKNLTRLANGKQSFILVSVYLVPFCPSLNLYLPLLSENDSE